jgi:hypothetical protein
MAKFLIAHGAVGAGEAALLASLSQCALQVGCFFMLTRNALPRMSR